MTQEGDGLLSATSGGQTVVVHGWVYGLHNGLLEDLEMTVRSAEEVEPAYEQALAALKLRLSARKEKPASQEAG